ncbi:TonB-dependent receptor [Leptolyngbya sp. FACHB-541]|uniref:TonB-dependent receptor n=1 Tax=Leptolyngbya sp. FACHB-541 TaxID=2692810 RepID=UPI00168A1824|nr:TonB-dependent receptor [Leptolyngbya sp. FACHB-541]MBD1997177.1 TonB-dependent receptor [Leptolyngbya sp. FACHB-541]
MMNQLQRSIFVATVLSVCCVQSAWAEVNSENLGVENSLDINSLEQVSAANSIPQISELEPSATTVDEWITQIAQSSIVEITGIQVNPSDAGLEVTLEITGTQPTPSTSVVGNALIINIPAAVLSLSDADEFQQSNPAEGIALISATNLPNNRVRVAITGADAPPTVSINGVDQNLILSITSNAESVGATEEDAIQVVVTDEQEEGYIVDNSTTATRTDTLILEVPGSIQIVPQQVIQEQNALRLPDIFRNVSGIGEEGGFGDALDQFNIRGFTATGQIFRNGIRVPNVFSPLVETENLERVEILKGPASVLYGALEPGGIINLVTEQPLDDPRYAASLSVGSFGLLRPTFDLTGPLNADETLLYRINAVYETGERWRDFDTDIDRFYVSPVLTWRISDRTDLTIDGEYLYDERPVDRGIPAIGDRPADIPRDRVFGDPDDFIRTESYSLGYQLEHELNDDWRVRNAFRFLQTNSINLRLDPFSPEGLDETTGILTRAFNFNDPLEESYIVQTDVVGEFATGPVDHTLLFGVDYVRQYQHFETFFGDAIAPINIFDPVYEELDRPSLSDFVVPGFDIVSDSVGIFLQDQIDLTDDLILLVGGRFDFIDQESIDIESSSTTTQYDEAFSPRVGIVYQPIEDLSFYASFSRSLVLNDSVQADGSFLEPIRGTQYEIGVKGELLDGRLLTTLAAYNLTRTNIGVPDPENIDFFISTGEQRSRGIELDVLGEILPGWNVIASLGYIEAEVTEDGGSELEGNRLRNVPDYTASLWTSYEIQSGNLAGLGFGAGIFYIGNRAGDAQNTFELPSYLRTDAALYYQRDNWQVALNVKNLFDVEYFESVNFGRLSIEPGAPRTVVGTVSVEF